mmetsp:Transcript_28761/g.67020  ORF Transcript_28761/g.67020 Transcript_28761/m.67020 type:complete len:354 (-) Transcript_28761:122-1183(-)
MLHSWAVGICAASLALAEAVVEPSALTQQAVDDHDDDVSLLQVAFAGHKAAVQSSIQGHHVSPMLVQAAHRMNARRALGPGVLWTFAGEGLLPTLVPPGAFVNATNPQRHFGAEPFCTGNDPDLQQVQLAEDCRENHFEDWYRPIPEVAKDHPGTSMYCYLGTYSYANVKGASWCVGGAEVSLRSNSFVVTQTTGRFLSNEGQRHYIHYDGGNISTTNHLFGTLYDDTYCHANGWFQNQDVPYELIFNGTALAEVSAKQCKELLALFPESDLSLPYMSYLQQGETEALRHHAMGLAQKAPSKLDMQRHAAVKCALGGVATEIAYCLDNGCMQPDGYIGRASMCASPDDVRPAQ